MKKAVTKVVKKLSAKQLKIHPRELEALLHVRKGMVEGRYEHRSEENPYYPTSKPIFNMHEDFQRWRCGQVGCIGGWMAFEMGLDNAQDYVSNNTLTHIFGEDHDDIGIDATECSSALVPLFFPGDGPDDRKDVDDWNDLSINKAIKAIDRFLVGKTKDLWI